MSVVVGAGRLRFILAQLGAVALLLATIQVLGPPAQAAAPRQGIKPGRSGGLDCNGLSPIQKAAKRSLICADPRAFKSATRFEDNGVYVGHDEPATRFVSSRPGSGGDVTFGETLPVEPAALPTVHNPGHDVTHSFELSVAPWFGMALCDPLSFPQTPCTPNSDRNAPSVRSPGGGSAFTEMQFYPPGFAPIVDAGSCDNRHWCAALLTFDFEATAGGVLNNNCVEPVNFAFVQTDGTPTGPPNPQQMNLSTFTPNSKTLLMGSGDRITVHASDADLGGGQHALREVVTDHTTGQTGFMTASAANGFTQTSIVDCSGFLFNFEPAYNTAKPANVVPWAILQGDIFNQFEIGHFEPCNRITGPFTETVGTFTDTAWSHCIGPYENPKDTSANNDDPPCYPKGDTHGGVAEPNLVTGCEPVVGPLPASSDVDFDGTSYWPDWPNKLTAGPFPTPFLQQQPTTVGGNPYENLQFQTTVPASEASCNVATGAGCVVPPAGPGHFYPYYTLADVDGTCVWEFGHMANGRTFGGDAQYGTFIRESFRSPILTNPTNCRTSLN
ncbi:MAG: hypothetical protein DLM59_11445 [Pseudonocardiales bacterium]|nr:MAG: hypothetical protein DLM59_11445 [Pseudonocardiales bacterium]